MAPPRLFSGLLLAVILLFSGCQGETNPQRLTYGMGERVPNGPLTYMVIESTWASQLGEIFQARVPRQRFLMLSISVTNGGGRPVNLPLLTLEDARGNQYQELADGTGVSNWLGILRTVDPGQTVQGRLLFDVPLAAFKLRLPDDGEAGYEKFAMVDIPLRIDSDQVVAPLPGPVLK